MEYIYKHNYTAKNWSGSQTTNTGEKAAARSTDHNTKKEKLILPKLF